MFFERPVTFEDAMQSRRVKNILPTAASSRELEALKPEIRERALFSARTAHAAHLAEIDRIVNRILDPDFITDPETGEKRRARPGEYISPAKARLLLKKSLNKLGYQPGASKAVPGSLKDLASDRRIDLIIQTQTRMARGYGDWAQSQSKAVLDEWPAQELNRHYQRSKPRGNWPERFKAAGGTLHGGRMIALKNSPVWVNLSRFSLPYPPFDYNSGMGVDDVDRDEAEKLGIIGPDEQIRPQSRSFNDAVQQPNPAEGSSEQLRQSIEKSMGDYAYFNSDNTLSLLPVKPLFSAPVKGDAASIGLKSLEDVDPSPVPGNENIEAARQMLKQTIPVQPPVDSPVIFGKRDIGHIDDNPEKRKGRLRHIHRATETVRTPDEIWDHPQADKISYLKVFQIEKKKKVMMVLVNRQTREVFNYWDTNITRNDKGLERRDVLLFKKKKE